MSSLLKDLIKDTDAFKTLLESTSNLSNSQAFTKVCSCGHLAMAFVKEAKGRIQEIVRLFTSLSKDFEWSMVLKYAKQLAGPGINYGMEYALQKSEGKINEVIDEVLGQAFSGFGDVMGDALSKITNALQLLLMGGPMLSYSMIQKLVEELKVELRLRQRLYDKMLLKLKDIRGSMDGLKNKYTMYPAMTKHLRKVLYNVDAAEYKLLKMEARFIAPERKTDGEQFRGWRDDAHKHLQRAAEYTCNSELPSDLKELLNQVAFVKDAVSELKDMQSEFSESQSKIDFLVSTIAGYPILSTSLSRKLADSLFSSDYGLGVSLVKTVRERLSSVRNQLWKALGGEPPSVRYENVETETEAISQDTVDKQGSFTFASVMLHYVEWCAELKTLLKLLEALSGVGGSETMIEASKVNQCKLRHKKLTSVLALYSSHANRLDSSVVLSSRNITSMLANGVSDAKKDRAYKLLNQTGMILRRAQKDDRTLLRYLSEYSGCKWDLLDDITKMFQDMDLDRLTHMLKLGKVADIVKDVADHGVDALTWIGNLARCMGSFLRGISDVNLIAKVQFLQDVAESRMRGRALVLLRFGHYRAMAFNELTDLLKKVKVLLSIGLEVMSLLGDAKQCMPKLLPKPPVREEG